MSDEIQTAMRRADRRRVIRRENREARKNKQPTIPLPPDFKLGDTGTCQRQGCGKMFTRNAGNQLFCSVACRRTHLLTSQRQCEEPGCAESFQPVREGQRFCSPKCRRAYSRAKVAREQPEHFEVTGRAVVPMPFIEASESLNRVSSEADLVQPLVPLTHIRTKAHT